MSILAEPRRKQRISVDPQNITWKSDNGKIGQKLLEKMGWSEGKGLGQNEQGVTENIRLKANHTAHGLGSEGKKHNKVWMAHHDDFESLLANLNKSKKDDSVDESISSDKANVNSEEKDATQSRIQTRYRKFTRGKDLSLYSDKDKSAILGISKKKLKQIEPIEVVHPVMEESSSIESSTNTTVSKMSMNDYFASKMATLKARNGSLQDTSQKPNEENTHEMEKLTTEEEKKKEKRKNKRKNQLDNDESTIDRLSKRKHKD